MLEEKPIQCIVESVEKKKEKKNPPLLYNLAELQNDCSKRFKISPDEALRVVQELYEKKLVTYPRTDARVLSTAVAKEISRNLNGLSKYPPAQPYLQDILSFGSHKNLAKQMNIPVLGIIENYSYVKCPDCGKEIKVFGESHVEEAAREMNVPVLGRMPIDMKLAEAVENEKFYEAENPYLADVKL